MEIKKIVQGIGFVITLLVYSNSCFSQTINYDRTIKQYIVAEFVPNITVRLDESERMQIQKEHMQYIQSLAKDKKLVLAGPYLSGGGLFILNTTEEEQAEKWVQSDPTIKHGLNTYVLKKWMTEKGLFTLDNGILSD